MEEVQQRREGSLLNATISRRGALVAGAWSVPVVAVAVATPMAAASGDINPLTELEVLAIGGAEGRYPTGANYKNGVADPNQDFRRAFSIKNTGTGSFTGSLTITFTFPREWNSGSGPNMGAFNNMTTVDLEGRGGAAVAGASAWVTSEDPNGWEENWGTNANTAVWFRMDPAAVTLTGVSLPPGGTVIFALNAEVPQAWIGASGVYIPSLYWRTDVFVSATKPDGTVLGTYGPVPDPDTSSNWRDGIWRWNGGGPFAYDGGQGLYPAHGNG